MEVANPYEQHLLSVFESCDDYYQGSLSAAGLHQLCEKLEILDQYGKLTQKLLGNFKLKRVFFHEFKEELLKLLSGIDCDEKTDIKLSPGKKVPKNNVVNENQFKKNLGIENNDIDDELSSDDLSDTQQNNRLSYSTDDVSSEESIPKRRRTRSNRRRGRKAFEKSGKNKSLPECLQTAPPANASNEVEHLIAAWSTISRGVTESLRRGELVKVFQCVGLERGSEEAAECVFEKLGLDENGGITLPELLEFIRSGGSWSKGNRSQNMETEAGQKSISMEYMEPSILGCVTIACLIEQLDSAGVPGSHQLFKSLGFQPSQQIELSSLVSMLSEEIKSMTGEMKSTKSDSHLDLLKANLVLQNLYIQNLKSTIEHVNAEKEKLRNDVFDANQRAVLLAQEVDDHNSKLEHSTQLQVRIMEQKHSDKIRELTNQAKAEQDTLLSQNMVLEKRLKVLEQEGSRNKLLIAQLEVEGRALEQEHRTVMDQLAAVQATKEKLEEDLENVSALQQKVLEMESSMKENDVVSLLERIRTLEFENTSLRDRNDELSVEVEELSRKLLNTSIKKHSSSSNLICMDQSMEESVSGVAMKRRGDSFVVTDSGEDSGGEEGSPRLGKVRKCSHVKDFAETTTCLKELQIQGENNEADIEDVGGGKREEEKKSKNENSFKITPFLEELEQAGEVVGKKLWSDEVERNLQKIEDRLNKYDQELAREVIKAFREMLKDEKDKSKASGDDILKTRCQELEASLELLKEEYEKTEDYWSEKLEDERAFFEEEQKLSDKKYSELLEKILEYEEMWNAEREQRQRLETIEEKDSFERQVADMEQECSELKSKLAEAIREKEMELEKLKSEISSRKLSRDYIDSGVQVSDIESGGEGNDKWKTSSRRSSSNQSSCRQCEAIKNLIEIKLKYQRDVEMMREERNRLLREMNERRQKLSGYSKTITGSERVNDLERKCHTLLGTLRQQQKQTEDILKNTWKQHKAEVKDLKSVLKMTEEKLKCQTKVIQEQLAKLAKTDLLVKDLFVENAFLVSSIQKLEQKCHLIDRSTQIGS